MNEKIFTRTIQKDDFYKLYFRAMNGFLQLTSREFEVLVELCKIQAQNMQLNYTPEQLSKIVFGPTSRDIIRTQLSISPYNLNNIIKVLKAKKIILQDEKKLYRINPQLFVPLAVGEYGITYKFVVT